MSWDTAGFLAHAFGPAAQGMAALPLPKTSAYVLADGDPDILELLNGNTNYLQAAPGGVAQPRLQPGYLALRVLDIDRAGRIDRAVVWPVSCPPTGADLPEGLVRAAGRCVAQAASAVRSQAKALPPFQSFFLTWVTRAPRDTQL